MDDSLLLWETMSKDGSLVLILVLMDDSLLQLKMQTIKNYIVTIRLRLSSAVGRLKNQTITWCKNKQIVRNDQKIGGISALF